MWFIVKFGNVVLDALFWMLIIFSIAGAGIWVFMRVVNYLFLEKVDSTTKLSSPENEEE